MSDTRRWVLKWTRTLHIYLTMLALLLLLFFAATGFMLNHADWFGLEEVQTSTATGELPTALLAEPDKLAVVELLRSQFGAVGAVDTFEIEEDSLRIVFRGPGRQSEAHVKRDTGEAEVVSESHGVVGRLTDLHKGKYAGAAWGAIIDGVSGLLLVVSMTGLALWLSLQRRRRLGMIVLALSFALSVGIYLAFVP